MDKSQFIYNIRNLDANNHLRCAIKKTGNRPHFLPVAKNMQPLKCQICF